ncbi:MAG: hypothetical protein IJZ64_05470 [Ruminococcus sp.]|nr:hypothetical protein [Ruminococcus sp.]
MKIKYINLIFCVFVAALLFVFIHYGCNNNYIHIHEYEKEFFGEETCEELKEKCTKNDKDIVQPILDTAEKAFSYLGDENLIENNFGILGKYSLASYKDVISETHKIKFLTAKLDENSGYIWINYSQRGYDINGKIICGSRDINTRWSLEKIDNKWVVIKTKEAP